MLPQRKTALGLSYIDIRPHLPRTLLFLHGNSFSLKTFRNQFESLTLKDYRIIAFDLEGHGESQKIPTYSLTKFALKTAEFISFLELRDYVLVGHSLGGHIGLHMLSVINSSSLPAGVVIYGTPPIDKLESLGKAFLPHKVHELIYKPNLSQAEVVELINSFYNIETEFEVDIEDINKVDDNFKISFPHSIGAGDIFNEVLNIQNFSNPLAIFHGEYDPVISLEYIQGLGLNLWRGRVELFRGSGHSIHRDNPSQFNQNLFDFCKEVFE